LRKNLKFIILAIFTLFIFWFFGRNLDWAEVSQSLQKAKVIYLIPAVLIICLGYLLRAKRWQVLLSPITETSLKELFATTTVGFTAVFLIGRAGEIVRPMWLPMRDKRVRPSAALVTLGLERIFDLASLICFFAINSLWIQAPIGKETQFNYVKMIAVLMLIGVIIGFIALYLYQRNAASVIAWFEQRSFTQNRLGKIFLSVLRQLGASLAILRDWKQVVAVSFWTFLLWLAISIPTWLVILAFDVEMNFSQSIFVMWWAAIGSLVPTPGGAAGAFHTATKGGLTFLGTEENLAAAVSLVMHLVYFAPAIIFGIYYFFHGDITIEKFRGLLSSEHAVEEIESESPNQ
jgi:glycosyltransferase 2 family protein